jgi:hypothetical protein
MMPRTCLLTAIAFASLATCSHASIVYLTQARSISASTSADLNTQTITAPDNFAPFVEALTLQTTFAAANGTTRPNRARTQVNNTADPNAILASGNFECAGGQNAAGDDESGEARVSLFFTFEIAEPTPWNILASARANTGNPGDRFEIEFQNLTTTDDIFYLDETSPAQTVNIGGILQPGRYSLYYENEFSSSADLTTFDYTFAFTVPTPGALGLAATAGIIASRRRRTTASV